MFVSTLPSREEVRSFQHTPDVKNVDRRGTERGPACDSPDSLAKLP